MRNRFEKIRSNGLPVTLGMTEEDVIKLYTGCCKYCISDKLNEIPPMKEARSVYNEVPYLEFAVSNFNEWVIVCTLITHVVGSINRKQSIRGMKRRAKRIRKLTSDLLKVCEKKYDNEHARYRTIDMNHFYRMCKRQYLTYPPRSMSRISYQKLVNSPYLSVDEKQYLGTIYWETENGIYSSKKRINRKNFLYISDLIGKGRK